MTTKSFTSTEMSSIFFEIGLALKLKKITIEDVEKHLPQTKIGKIISKIEDTSETWDDSHITPGDRLKSALEMHEISQADLAKKLKTTSQKINDLIKGRLTLNTTWAKKLAKAFNVDYRTFL